MPNRYASEVYLCHAPTRSQLAHTAGAHGEGAVEGGMSCAGNGAECELNAALNRDGDRGQRDPGITTTSSATEGGIMPASVACSIGDYVSTTVTYNAHHGDVPRENNRDIGSKP